MSDIGICRSRSDNRSRSGGWKGSAGLRWRDGRVGRRRRSTASWRNRLPSGGYQPGFAAGSYPARRERLGLLERDKRLERFVVDRLTEGWAPEQSAARHGLLAMAASQLDRAAFWRAMAEGRHPMLSSASGGAVSRAVPGCSRSARSCRASVRGLVTGALSGVG
jgi:hypothetical protein